MKLDYNLPVSDASGVTSHAEVWIETKDSEEANISSTVTSHAEVWIET